MNAPARPGTVVDRGLVRAYRILVWIYPRGPRRDEMLDTLLEGAPPGRQWPTLRETVNVFWYGNRAQFGRRKPAVAMLLALLIAAAAGFIGSVLGHRVGFEAVGPLPVGSQAAEIRETVFPGLAVLGGGDAAKIVSQSDGEGVEYGYAVSWVKHTAATRDVAGYTAGVRSRLKAAGWTVTGVDPPVDQTNVVNPDPGAAEEGFTAERGALGLRFSDAYGPGRPAYDGDGNASYLVWHQPPPWLSTYAWIGAVLAALIGWYLAAWVSRILAPAKGLGSLVAVGGGGIVLGILPGALLSIPTENTASETASPYWQGLVYLGLFPAVLSAIGAVLMLGVCLLIRAQPLFRAIATGWAELRRRPRAFRSSVLVVVLLAGLGLFRVTFWTCDPAVPSGIEDPPQAALSYRTRIFIDAKATDDQRNLAQAAIGRGNGGGLTFNAGTASPGFTGAFCGSGRLPGNQAADLPWFWTVDLASPGMFLGLAAEAMTMPGVVAAQHVPA